MITKKERLLSSLRALPDRDVRDIIKMWAVSAARSQKALHDAIVSDGFERVEVQDGVSHIGDGDDLRSVIWVRGTAYALPADEHRRRRDEAIAEAEEAARAAQPEDTKSVVGTESLSLMVCPKCGDSLQHTAVCPKCAAGKLGYRHRYTCVCGGVDLISKEAL